MAIGLYNLGKVPWADSQLIYHALGSLGREALSLVSPATPYVCVGFHQETVQEVDLDYCRQAGIPLFKREVGGGAVYLDGNQLFFQLILRRDNPLLPANRDRFYRRFLEPVVEAYRRLGIDASFKPVNDVVTGTKKISGTGVGEIGPCVVFVGNMILDFDFQTMARVLKVPDEKFRDKFAGTMQANMSTIRHELGPAADQWTEERLNAIMADEFAKVLGPLEPLDMDAELRAEMDRLAGLMLTEDWLMRKGRRLAGRKVKVRAGLELFRRSHKAPGGLLKAEWQLVEGYYQNVSISGDIFAFPPSALESLEQTMEGAPRREAAQTLEYFLERTGSEFPGVSTEDWLALLKP